MIVLSKESFDALASCSKEYGGVGAGTDWTFDGFGPHAIPCCIHGLAAVVNHSTRYRVTRELLKAGVNRNANDEAVRAINARKKRNTHARVDFITEYCPELGIVRGE